MSLNVDGKSVGPDSDHSSDVDPAVANSTHIDSSTVITSSSGGSKQTNHLVHAASGSVAGVMSKTLLQPLDLVKTRLQVQNANTPGAYRGLGDAFRTVYRQTGVRGFYQGFTPNLVGSALSWGSYFYVYNMCKRFARTLQVDPNQPLSPLANFVSAATAGSTTVLLTNPVWVIKTRLQLQNMHTESHMLTRTAATALPASSPPVNAAAAAPYRGILHAFRRITQEEGARALYRGVTPALSLVSNSGITVCCLASWLVLL